jgi:hypothetical protein
MEWTQSGHAWYHRSDSLGKLTSIRRVSSVIFAAPGGLGWILREGWLESGLDERVSGQQEGQRR